MTSRERVESTGRALRRLALGRSVMSAMAAGIAGGAVAWLAGAWFSAQVGELLTLGIGAGAAALAARLTFRAARGPGFSVSSVALWIEERRPELAWALITAVEGGPAADQLERRLSSVSWTAPVREAARRALGTPVLALMGALALVAAVVSVRPALREALSEAPRGTARVIGTALDIEVQVRPPAYTGRPAERFRNPVVVRAIVGSELAIETPAGDSVVASLGGRPLGPAAAAVRLRVGPDPAALQVARSAGGSSNSGREPVARLIAIDPIPDSQPAVTLRQPAHDTVLARPAGALALGAGLHDDFGLQAGAFEYIVSSGSGESFTFTSGVVGRRRLEGVRDATMAATLSLDALGLRPGDVLHVRAVALDARDDTAAARGSSETRTIRIARTGELDSVAVEAAAPADAVRAVLSERMLINLAESLLRRRRDLQPAQVVEESRGIARDQARLRRQVGDLVFSRLESDATADRLQADSTRPPLTPDEMLKAAEAATGGASGRVLDFEGDETPVVAVNRPLLEAYNFMWDAGRDLDQGEPGQALPAMYRALDAIQRARAAERLYLRSRPSQAVVDVPRVRLQGRERGAPSPRVPAGDAASADREALAVRTLWRLAAVARLAATDPVAASDSLLLVRLDLVGHFPDATALAERTSDAWRRGADARILLGDLRRALLAVTARDSLLRWRDWR